MAILIKGVDFTTGQQVSAANLDNLVDLATFDTGAVDNSTTQLSGGAIIVKDGGITSAKLGTNIAVAGTLSANGLVTFANVTSIGNTTPGTGAFTTLSATGQSTFAAVLAAAPTDGAHDLQSNGTGARLQIFGGTHATFAKQAFLDGDTITLRTAAGVTIATLTSSGLAVTGTGSFSGALTLGTDLAVTEGGTGASTASGARTNLGLVIGTDVQAYNANLTTYADIAPSANVQTLLGAANFSAFRTSLGVAIGTDVQAYDADLAALAALSGTNTLYYRSGAATWSPVTIGPNLTFSGGTLSASGGGSGTIGGSTGSTDNRILRADGTGGSTLQASGITIDDSNNITGVTTCDVGTGGYKVSGTKVIGAQSAAEADISLSTSLSGSDTVNAGTLASNFGALNGKINSILAKLRTHGLIAT